jgi:hypothetical protein
MAGVSVTQARGRGEWIPLENPSDVQNVKTFDHRNLPDRPEIVRPAPSQRPCLRSEFPEEIFQRY